MLFPSNNYFVVPGSNKARDQFFKKLGRNVHKRCSNIVARKILPNKCVLCTIF
jgi:hypothetical protein